MKQTKIEFSEVLFELLTRENAKDRLANVTEHPAEQVVLWLLENKLESILEQPLKDEYLQLLSEARRKVAASGGFAPDKASIVAHVQELEIKLMSLLQEYKDQLPESDFKELEELISKHGEYGIALENLCSTLEDRGVSSNTATHSSIIQLLKDMEFSEAAIEHYRSRLLIESSK